MQAINKGLEWVTRIAYLNMLWILATVAGLIVIGLFPAIAATFTIARKWVTGEADTPIWKSFWQAYRQSLKGANLLRYLIVVFGYILYLDFLFITVVSNEYALLLTIPFLFILILSVLTLFYVYPVYVYYDMSIFKTLKSAFFIMILNPLSTITMMLGILGILFILWQFQGLAIFFSMSILSLVLTMPAQRAFRNIQAKQDALQQTS